MALIDSVEPITPAPIRPVRRPIMLQGWHNLTSLHWRYPADQVQRLLPPGYTADVFDGSAWVGLIPFHMRRIRLPGLPAFGPLSTFPETNIRTYIVDPNGRRAVWFCSLDITRMIPTLVARVAYQLPYCWAHMSIEERDNEVTYTSSRRWPRRTSGAHSSVTVRRGATIPAEEVTELEHFLTARWALGTTLGKRLMWADVDHPAWPLQRCEVLHWDESLIESAGLPTPAGEPIALHSPGVEVRIALPRPL